MLPAMANLGKKNFYALAGYPDCTQSYQGQYAGTAIFVVAPGDPVNERLFPWAEYEAAAAYATQLGYSQMDNVPTTSLCQQAVEAVYG